jgi:hypothetical protein
MAGIWLCSACHSANRDGSQRCYKCRTQRAGGEMREAAAAIAAASAQQATANLAAAARRGARYRPSWILGLLTVVLSMASIWLEWRLSAFALSLVGPDSQIHASNSQAVYFRTQLVWAGGIALAGTFVWGLWIALIVANVPALTARWTPHTPLGVFLSVWVPILNLKRPYTAVRNTLRILAGGATFPGLIAGSWWLAALCATLLPTAAEIYTNLAGGFDFRRTLVIETQLRLAFVVAAGVLGAVVVFLVELHQRRAAMVRATVVMLADQATAAT